MNTITSLTQNFLNQKNIAIVGVSSKRNTPANGIYRKLKSLNYNVFGVAKNSTTFENDPCYPDLKSIPATVDGVFVVTSPENTLRIVEQCVELKIPRVWMHCSGGTKHNPASEKTPNTATSVSQKAVDLCRQHNIAVIPGACPMMFCEPVDWFHKFMRRILAVFGKLRTE